ncbi:uncharacterized protein MELLADRAFT_114118 [Melampsora larici-populina 98AG31]|uniref:CxC1-like cysteine cluster associated with KDZ transposases domain-containing protein n=1 Tax=Melampsora larici-populina (strain 98AG31 / pathotype 3-4-7) TaxID=747676 RepID=F4SC85_MELLP|nr:uncharacterized protein MELLADRAFT_114118 [Melampsora larici-populina 98AG31]EGF97737.1 hypothetical protein MELLADRAFT_114118 [Melampsora larici-populina 98AG31]
MLSRRIICGLNHRPKPPKASTPLQRQHELTWQRDLEHAEASDAALARRLNEPNARQNCIGDEVMAEDLHEVLHHDLEPPLDDQGNDEHEMDLNQFMPMPNDGHPENFGIPDDPMLAALRRQQHLAERLANKNQWLWQYAIMLPTFLRRHLETSNWANQLNWNEDVRPPCNCSIKTERDVDLLDILSPAANGLCRRLTFEAAHGVFGATNGPPPLSVGSVCSTNRGLLFRTR